MPEDYNSIRPWLINLLNSKEMSVETLSKRAGVSRASLYFYMNDIYRPTEGSMHRICTALGVPFEEGLRQYTVRKAGRPFGEQGQRPLRARTK